MIEETIAEKNARIVTYLHAFLTNPYNYGSFKTCQGAFLLSYLFNENIDDKFDEKTLRDVDVHVQLLGKLKQIKELIGKYFEKPLETDYETGEVFSYDSIPEVLKDKYAKRIKEIVEDIPNE